MSPTKPPGHQTRPLVVVLTGGISSGKTTVSELFTELGVPIVDMDEIANQLVKPGKPALFKIIEAFGSGFLLCDETLDRKKMRKAIFSQPELKKRLEGILHPLIFEESIRQIELINFPYCILVIPLYADLKIQIEIDRVLVVNANESAQVNRLMARDSTSRKMATSMKNAQATQLEYLKLADDVINNSGSKFALKNKVELLHQKYLNLARQNAAPVAHQAFDDELLKPD